MSHKILLLRHAEANKNLEDRHGGLGSSLSPKGRRQCEIIARSLQERFEVGDDSLLIGHKIPQVAETINSLSEILGVLPNWDERIKGIFLGKIAGLSREEARIRFPEAAERLELWRSGRLPIDKLILPEAEPIGTFRARIEAALRTWVGSNSNSLIVAVCTRSTLIMLVNLVSLGAHFSYERYQVYHFSEGGLTELEVEGSNVNILAVNSSKLLADNDR